MDVDRKGQNSNRGYVLSVLQALLSPWVCSGLRRVAWCPHLPALGQWRMGHTRGISAVDVMPNAASS